MKIYVLSYTSCERPPALTRRVLNGWWELVYMATISEQ